MKKPSNGSNRLAKQESKALQKILTEAEIKQKIRNEGWTHPATTIPIGAGAVALIWGLFIADSFFGGAFFVVILAPILLLVGLANAGYKISLKGSVTFSRISLEMSRLKKQLDMEEEEEALKERRATLRRGYIAIGRDDKCKDMASRALGELEDLYTEHQGLQQAITQERNSEGPELFSDIPEMAFGLYTQGLGIHEGILPAMEKLNTSDEAKLRAELKERQRTLKDLMANEGSETRIASTKESIASHEQRLKNLKMLSDLIEAGIIKSDQCEAEIAGARVDVVKMFSERAEGSYNEMKNRLARVSEYRRAVEEQMNITISIDI